MRRVLLSLATIVVLWFTGRALVRFFASDATKIRWTVDAMIDGFNDTRTNPVLDGLDREFLDETFGADREMVRAACVQLFFQAKDPETKSFLYRAEWSTKSVSVTKASGGEPKAECDLDVRFFRRKGEAEEPAWSILVHATFVERDGEWRILRSETRTVDGERLR